MQTGFVIYSKKYSFEMPLNAGFNVVYNNFVNHKSKKELFTISATTNGNTNYEFILFPNVTLNLFTNSMLSICQENSAVQIKNPANTNIILSQEFIDFKFMKRHHSYEQPQNKENINADPNKLSIIDLSKKSITFNSASIKRSVNISSKKDLCAICHSEFGEKIGLLQCGHWYCWICINMWAERSLICPLCKKEFSSVQKYIEGFKIKEKYFKKRKVLICSICNEPINDENIISCDMCEIMVSHIGCVNEQVTGDVAYDKWTCFMCNSN